MRLARAFTIHFVATWVDISSAARVQSNRLLNTLNHLGELANLQKHANGTLDDSATTDMKEEAASNVVSFEKRSNNVAETRDSGLQKYADDDSAMTGLEEEGVSNVGSLGLLANNMGEAHVASFQKYTNEPLHDSATSNVGSLGEFANKAGEYRDLRLQRYAHEPPLADLGNKVRETRDSRLHSIESLHGSGAVGMSEQVASNVASLGELSNSVGETRHARLKHTNESLHDSAKAEMEGNASNEVSFGKFGLEFNASRAIDLAIAYTGRNHVREDAVLFGLALIIMLFIGCCWAKGGLLAATLGGWLTSSLPAGSAGRRQYFYEGRVIYEWEQKRSTIFFYTMLPKDVKMNDIEVKIRPKHLRIAIHGKHPFINEELYSFVDDSRSTWNISRQGELSIRMKKAEPDVQWPCIIQAHLPSDIDMSETSDD